MMSLIIGTIYSCTNSSAKQSEKSFNREGKIRSVNHTDSTITVVVNLDGSQKEVFTLYPVPKSPSIAKGDSALFYLENNLRGEQQKYAEVKNLTIIPIKPLLKEKKKK